MMNFGERGDSLARNKVTNIPGAPVKTQAS
jgi:hypothetical protein